MPVMKVRPGLTLWLGSALVALSVASWLAWLQGERPFWIHLLVMGMAQYFVCICVHDGVHKVLVRSRGWNQVLAFVLSLSIGLPFPLLQATHLQHHRMVGASSDAEHWVYGATAWELPFRLPLVPFVYLATIRHLDWPGRLATLLHMGLVIGAFVVGGEPLLVGWGIPTLVAVMWFGFTTVYAPHSAYAPTLMRYFRGHSGYHEDHHRDVRYPFHQYARLRYRHLVQGTAEGWAGETRFLAWLTQDVWS